MEELKKLVEKLEAQTDEKEIIATLQEIGKKLITDYEIKIKDLTIEPLLVEAYYCKENIFCDCNCHQSPMQTNKADEERFGKIYQHAETEENGGIDICLPLGKSRDNEGYYLSFLIKVALINRKPCKQQAINGEIVGLGIAKETVQQMEGILHASHKNLSTVCIPRKGTTKGKYVETPLAVLAVDSFKEGAQKIAVRESMEKGQLWALAKYALEKNNQDEEKARKCIKEEGLYPDHVDDDAFAGARKYIEEWK